MFEQNVPGPWKARHGLTDAAFAAENQQARDDGQILRWVCLYGRSGRSALNVGLAWQSEHYQGQTVEHAALGQYQVLFELAHGIPRFRLARVAVAPDQTLSAVFNDEGVGARAARHGA